MEILKEVSETLEEDLLFFGEKYIKDIKEDIEMINRQIIHISDKISDYTFMDKSYRYYMEVYENDMGVPLESLKPLKHESQIFFEEKLSDLMSRS